MFFIRLCKEAGQPHNYMLQALENYGKWKKKGDTTVNHRFKGSDLE